MGEWGASAGPDPSVTLRADIATARADAGTQRDVLRALREASRPLFSRAAISYFFIGIGIVLRSVQYFSNRSLSFDESLLALNITLKSFGELTDTLDFNQAAPLGFLQVEKLFVEIFGNGEYSLRLFPFLGSIAALFLFHRAAKRLVDPNAALLALALFAVYEPFIFFSATAKQYAIDVAVALLLYAWVAVAPVERLKAPGFLAYTVVGALVVWLSHPSGFILAAIGVVTALRLAWRADWMRLSLCALAYTGWLLSFMLQYFLSRATIVQLQASFGRDSPNRPFIATPSPAEESALSRVVDSLTYVVGIEDTASGEPLLEGIAGAGVSLSHLVSAVAFVAAAIGFISLVRSRRASAALLTLPALLAGLAAVLGRYPLAGRTVLFVIPAFVLMAAQGVVQLAKLIPVRRTSLVRGVLTLLLIASVVAVAVQHVARSHVDGGIKAAVEHLAEHGRPGDTLYLAYPAQYAFRYYAECDCSDQRAFALWPMARARGGRSQFAPVLASRRPSFILGLRRGRRADTAHYIRDLQWLRGRERVWVLLHDEGLDPDGTKNLLLYLESIGTREQSVGDDEYPRTRSALYLFDLRTKETSPRAVPRGRVTLES